MTYVMSSLKIIYIITFIFTDNYVYIKMLYSYIMM